MSSLFQPASPKIWEGGTKQIYLDSTLRVSSSRALGVWVSLASIECDSGYQVNLQCLAPGSSSSDGITYDVKVLVNNVMFGSLHSVLPQSSTTINELIDIQENHVIEILGSVTDIGAQSTDYPSIQNIEILVKHAKTFFALN